MGKRGKRGENNGLHKAMSIREETSGKKQTYNPKTILKLKHVQNLAIWASDKPEISSFGAFFGHSFAGLSESLGIPPDPSLFPCQRCETILQSGSNCTVRIEKIQAKRCTRTKCKTLAHNTVIYTCHFCSHRNSKRGTPKGYVKELAPSKTVPESFAIHKGITSNATVDKANATDPLAASNENAIQMDSPANLTVNYGVKLLDSKRKRKRSRPMKSGDDVLVNSAPTKMDKDGGTSKRKRKTWTSLKQMAENEQRERNKRFSKFSIPFVVVVSCFMT